MAELGADPVQLREVSREMRNTQRQLEDSQSRLSSMTRAVPWHGRDADRFRADWTGSVRRLRRAAHELGEAADVVERNAVHQERTSEAEAPTFAGRTLHGSAALEARSATTSWPDGHVPIPERVETWVIDGEVAAAFGVRAGSRLVIEDLPGATSMVWVQDSAGALVSGGAGFEFAVDESRGATFGADASAGITLSERRGWEIADGDLGTFLAKVGIGEALDRVPALGGNPLSVSPVELPLIGSAVDSALDGIGLGPGDPQVHDHLAAIEAEAGIAAAASVPLAGVSIEGSESIGLRERGDRRSLLWEVEGSYGTEMGGGGSAGSGSVSVELPWDETDPAHSGNQTVIVTTTTTEGADVRTTRHVQAVDAEIAGDVLGHAAKQVVLGDPSQAAEALAPVLLSIDPESAWTDTASGLLRDDLHGVDLSSTLGGKLGASIRGGRTVVEYGG